MTTIEVSPGQIFCSCDDRAELLALVGWLVRNFEKMETRHQKAITILDFIDIPPIPTAPKVDP